MSFYYIEDELGSPLERDFCTALGIPEIQGIGALDELTTEPGEANVHVFLGRYQEGWDWALHNLLKHLSREGAVVLEMAGFEGDDLPLGLFERLMAGLDDTLKKTEGFRKIVEDHRDALNVLCPEVLQSWLPSKTIPAPFDSDRPDLEDTSHVDSTLDGIASFIRHALLLAHQSSGRPPVLGVTNVQWFDPLSASLLSRLCRSALRQPFYICVHLDGEDTSDPLLKLARSLAHFGWAKVYRQAQQESEHSSHPLCWRDAQIARLRRPAAASSVEHIVLRVLEEASEHTQAQLLIVAFANWELPDDELNCVANLYLGKPTVACSKHQAEDQPIRKRFLMHPLWKQVIRGRFRSRAQRVVAALAAQQKLTCAPIHQWPRPLLHLLAREGTAQELGDKLCECSFRLYEKFGKRADAIAFCERARQQCPSNCELAVHLGWLYGLLRDQKKALDCYQAALLVESSRPLRVLLLCRLAVLLAKTGDNYATGTSLIKEAVSLVFGMADEAEILEAKVRIANAGAFLLFRAGEFNDSLEVLRNAEALLETAPLQPLFADLRFSVRKNMAKVLQKQPTEFGAAVEAYQDLLQSSMGDDSPQKIRHRVVALFSLGIIYARAGNPRVADHYFRRIVDLPYSAFRMSVSALSKYVVDLFCRLHYAELARGWMETRVNYYLADNRIYDALSAWRTQISNFSAEDPSYGDYLRHADDLALRYGILAHPMRPLQSAAARVDHSNFRERSTGSPERISVSAGAHVDSAYKEGLK